MTDAVLAIEGLTIDLPAGADRPHAVEELDLTIGHNEIVCLVGESGSGKSVTAQAVLGLLPKAQLRVSAGTIIYGGMDLVSAPQWRLRQLRGHDHSLNRSNLGRGIAKAREHTRGDAGAGGLVLVVPFGKADIVKVGCGA